MSNKSATESGPLRWAELLDAAAAYIVERTGPRSAVWERNWITDYDALLGPSPNLVCALMDPPGLPLLPPKGALR